MNIRTQQKRFAALADLLRGDQPINNETRQYLSNCIEAISKGADANVALGIAYGPGHKEKSDIDLEARALIFWWITCAMQPTSEDGYGFNFEQALDAALQMMDGQWINPITKEVHVYKDINNNLCSPFMGKKYSEDTLRRLWREKANNHMKKTTFTALDIDSPIKYK